MERLALKDDWTSTGGRVIGGSSNWFAEGGRPFALADDKASCGNCKGAWPIAGNVQDCMDNGRAMVKDLARVFCPCGKNFVYASGNSPFFWSGGGGRETTQAITSPQTDDEFEHYFEIVDAMSGAPIEGMAYTLISDDVSLVKSESLAAGKTKIVSMNDYPNLTFIAWRTGDVR